MNTTSFLIFVTCTVVIAVYVVCEENFVHSEDLSKYVDELILSNEEISSQIDKESWLWNEYQFESGFVNREELRITDIEIWHLNLQQSITNWQYVNHKYESYIAGSENSTLFLYHFDLQNNRLTPRANLSIAETIKSFKIISFSFNDEESTEIKDSIIVILSVEDANDIQYLKWYFLQNQKFYSFWIWELIKKVKSLTYFNVDDNHKLAVLYEKDVYFNHSYSLIEVYDIETSGQFSKQLCCQFLVTEIFDIRICPSRDGSKTFALLDRDYVTLHEYKDILSKCVLKSMKNITVSNVNNVICFESSNINHLAVSGFVTNFFKFHLNEYIDEREVETLLNEVGDVHFLTNLAVDTYRNDVILFIQSRNLSVFALCWENEKFQFVRLPNNKLNDFDLSKVIVIPNYGFMNASSLIRFKVELIESAKPGKSDIETLFKMKSILEETLNTQESAISKIELEIQSSHLNDLKIENLSSVSQIDVDELSVNEINNFVISIESSNFTLDELQTNYEESRTLLHELRAEISQIENQVENTNAISSSDLSIYEEIHIDGNFESSGTAIVKSLFIDYLNNINVDVLMNNCLSPDKKIMGNKTFPSIKFTEGNLKIKNLNGVPIENFQFEEDNSFLTDIDFTKIKKLQVKDNLNFSKVNGINWIMLMDQLVLRNENKVIPGRTRFSGTMNTSFTRVDYLNDFEYPLEYVVKSGPESGEVTGVKTFETLTVSDLQDVKTINDIDADEFIILTADQNLEHKIIFENLVIEESLQIDGKIVGLPDHYVNPDLTLLNSNIVQSNAIFGNLNVSGKVYVENLVDGIEWSEIDDLILKNDEKSVIVTGTKIFQNEVKILGNLEIKKSVINDHPINSFITLDSRQILPNLSKLTGKVKFTSVTYEELENIEDILKMNMNDMGEPKCSTKPFVFLEAPIVDEFSTSFINENITGSDFSKKLEILLNDINFVNLKCKKLIVGNLKPLSVNSINLKDLEDNKITRNTYQELSGMININNFETKNLYSRFVNNRSYEQLENTVRKINSFYEEFISNQRSIYSLNTNKSVTTTKVNDKYLRDILDLNEKTNFWLRTNGSVEHLIVKGLVNNLNLTQIFADCVLKNEEFVTIKGPKKINRFKTNNLQVEYINSHSVQDILTDTRNQTLFGPLTIKGSAYVDGKFNSHGKINDFNYEDIHVDIGRANDTIYTFTGDFLIDDYVSINNLVVAGRIQDTNINQFLDNLIYLNDTNVTISSTKIFKTATFNDYITVSKRVNNVELELFYENGISIDKPTLVNSPIIFENDVLLEQDLIVENSLKVSTIKGIDIENMMENAVYFNRPTSIRESVTLSNVVFKSDITATFLNNTDLDMLLTLNEDKIIHDTLVCINVDAKNLTINGLLNDQNLTQVYENTFMISADQHVTGTMSFLNNFYVHGNLSSRYINDIDMTKIISLENSDPMEGNFVFEKPIVVHNDVVVQQYLNNINISQWHSNTIMTSSPRKNVVVGNWTIYGNIDFKGNVYGSGSINDVTIESVSHSMQRHNEEIESFILAETNDLKSICNNLQKRRIQTDNFLYKFKSFEYFRVLKFDKKIESVHHFEFNGTDYVLVNFETCHVDIYAHTNEGFLLYANASDFGNIKQYLNFYYKNNLYFVTAGKVKCGRNSGNLWMLENKQVKHIYDLGNVTNIEQLSEVIFVVTVDHQIQKWSIDNVHQQLFRPIDTKSIENRNVKFFSHNDDILLASCDIIYQFRNGTFELDKIENPFKSTDILSFKVGIHKREHILLYDDQMNSNQIFIYNEDLFQPKELQSIQAQKPNSFIFINFDGLYESLLVFSENKRGIQIYEYKGIEYFKFHSSIQMKVDKLYSFQLQTHPYLAKRRCIAIVHDFKLIILEAKMYGEKLDANNQFICTV